MKSAGLILAAGASSRMGVPKAMLPFNGCTYLTAVASRLINAGCEHIYIVTGAHQIQLPEGLAQRCTLVEHLGWRKGMRSSIAQGLKGIIAQSVCIQPVDAPGVLVQTIQSLIEIAPRSAVVPVYKGKSGHPVIAGEALQSRLLQNDSTSLRDVLKTVEVIRVDVLDRAVLNNINTPQAHTAFSQRPPI
jgi:CTP:molybdopterin cytidylyltransferase MocA